jgi:hypothetical protein
MYLVSAGNLSTVTVDDLLHRRYPWGHFADRLPELLYVCYRAQATMLCCVDELALLNMEVMHAWNMAEQRRSAILDFVSRYEHFLPFSFLKDSRHI